MPKYAHARNQRSNWDKHGERPSLLDFDGIVGDGIHDDAPGINDAIADVIVQGGRSLEIPAGFTFRCESKLVIPAGDANLTIVGDGAASVVKRGATLGAGEGLFDISGSNVALENFLIDGDVTTPTGLNYSTITDPMQDSLSRDTSIWVHEGAHNLTFNRLQIQHTGGYAILLDARDGDIRDVRILHPQLMNNRPHLFGTTAGDLNYGSWTGGIHFQGDCRASASKLFAVRGLLVSGGIFGRNSGNCIWSHVYGFDAAHSDIRIIGNGFEDCARDAILMAGISGGLVQGNVGRRIGYLCSDDASPSVPNYLPGQYAVFIDTAGLTQNVDYIGNNAVSVYGGFTDGDGFAAGKIVGNTYRTPRVTDLEYTEDAVSTWAYPTVGIQLASTYSALGSSLASITNNTIINCGAGAIRVFKGRQIHIADNMIDHPDTGFAEPPIMFGNVGSGSDQRTYNCDVVGNNIRWNPASPAAAIQEIENWGAGSLPWSGTDKNWVADNRLSGNCFEFQKAPSSVSTTATLISSQGPGLSAGAHVSLVREQISGVDFTSIYGPAGGLQLRILDAIGQLNMSINGVGGSITTGPRLGGLGVDDSVATSHLSGDGFLLLNDATFSSADADGFSDVWAILRYDSTAKALQLSTTVVSGHRTWATISAPGGAAGSVQFKDASAALAGTNNFTWNNAANILTIGGAGNGVVAATFNSSAVGSVAAVQQASGTFIITGAGNAAFQSVTLTNPLGIAYGGTGASTAAAAFAALAPQALGTAASVTFGSVVSGIFNSTATGGTSAVQQASGNFIITGAGNAAFQSVALTNPLGIAYGGTGASTAAAAFAALAPQALGTAASVTFGSVVSGIFNSTATGGTSAVQQASGNFIITGAGNAAFQSVTLTNPLGIAYGGTGASTAAAAFAALAPQALGTAASVTFGSVVSGIFNSTATGGTSAVQQASGNFIITGAGNAAFQSVTLTNPLGVAYGGTGASTAAAAFAALAPQALGTSSSVTFGSAVSGIFNSTATGGASAVQQASGNFIITGAGNAAFQSVAVTNGMTVAGVAAINSSGVFVGPGFLNNTANVAALGFAAWTGSGWAYGVSGTFRSNDATPKTVYVQAGIIYSII